MPRVSKDPDTRTVEAAGTLLLLVALTTIGIGAIIYATIDEPTQDGKEVQPHVLTDETR